MIRFEITGECPKTIAKALREFAATFGAGTSAPQTVVPADSQAFDPSVPAGTIIPIELASGETVSSAVERAAKKRRAPKGAGSEPEVVEAKEVVAVPDGPDEREKAEAAVMDVAQVREALLALLPDGKGGGVSDEAPEEVLTEFGVKKISGLVPLQYPFVHAAALKRLADWKSAQPK